MSENSEITYIDLLKSEYEIRKKKNPLFSTRIFATRLGLSAPYLSFLFSGKRHLSPKKALDISERLNWPASKQKYFLALLEYQLAQTDQARDTAQKTIQQYQYANTKKQAVIDSDVFTLISEWQYGAILSLLTLKNLKATSKTIQQRLKLTTEQTKNSLGCLQRLGLVKTEKNIWKALNDFQRVTSIPSEAIRTYHERILQLAAKALKTQNFNERDFSNITLTVDKNKIDQAKKKIVEFQNEMSQLLDGSNATEVYQLSVQLFRLTEPQELE